MTLLLQIGSLNISLLQEELANVAHHATNRLTALAGNYYYYYLYLLA